MASPLPDKKVVRLKRAIDYSRRRLKAFRENRMSLLKEYVGRWYSENGAGDRVPVNLIELTTNIYTRHLIAQRPRVLVTTFIPELKPAAYTLELAINTLLRQIRLERALEMAVMDAIFSIGIIKTGMGVYDQVEIEGVLHDIGQPFADVVDLDDWVHDYRARTLEEVEFCGNRYELPLDYVKESSLYTNTDNLTDSSAETVASEGYEETDVKRISRGQSADPDEFVKHIRLYDIWLPLDNIVVTLTADGEPKVLRVVEWDGPEEGPYRVLAFSRVPGQIMPLAPASTWKDIHELANRIYRKLGRQAERQKTVVAYRSAARMDAEHVRDANDGELINMDSPESVREIRYGGIDQPNLAFLIHSIDRFSWLAGNLDALGGLSAMSETATQDAMLREASGKRIQFMQSKTKEFVRDVVRDLAWYLWNDPLIEIPLVKRAPGTDIEVPVTFNQDAKEGRFFDYAIDIEPYSLQDQSPGEKLALLGQVIQNYIAPFIGLMAEQGKTINMEKLLGLVSRYMNLPELDEILDAQSPPTDNATPRREGIAMQPGGAQGSEQPRVVVRTQRPGSTRMGRDAAMAQALIGAGLQDSQASAIIRPGG